jgi:hypothetical protein
MSWLVLSLSHTSTKMMIHKLWFNSHENTSKNGISVNNRGIILWLLFSPSLIKGSICVHTKILTEYEHSALI